MRARTTEMKITAEASRVFPTVGAIIEATLLIRVSDKRRRSINVESNQKLRSHLFFNYSNIT